MVSRSRSLSTWKLLSTSTNQPSPRVEKASLRAGIFFSSCHSERTGRNLLRSKSCPKPPSLLQIYMLDVRDLLAEKQSSQAFELFNGIGHKKTGVFHSERWPLGVTFRRVRIREIRNRQRHRFRRIHKRHILWNHTMQQRLQQRIMSAAQQ